MNYWKKVVKKFSLGLESGQCECEVSWDSLDNVTLEVDNKMTLRLNEKDAIKLRDAISIGIIKMQDRIRFNHHDTSRVTNGDMG